MSVFAKRPPIRGEKCARCGRQFIPKHEGDKFGPKCARKRAGSNQLIDWELSDGTIETRNEKGELIEMIV